MSIVLESADDSAGNKHIDIYDEDNGPKKGALGKVTVFTDGSIEIVIPGVKKKYITLSHLDEYEPVLRVATGEREQLVHHV